MAAFDAALADQLAALRDVLVFAMLLGASEDEERILDLVTSAVPSLTESGLAAVHLTGRGWHLATGAWNRAEARPALENELVALGPNGGRVTIVGETWSEAFALRTDDPVGHLVVVADREPPPATLLVLRVLADLIGVAIANARLVTRERASAADVLRSKSMLVDALGALERRAEMHERLLQAALDGAGHEGIARVVHELTGMPVAVEDPFGNLRAWAGPGRPDPYPKPVRARRDALLRRFKQESGSVTEAQSVFAAVRAGDQILGVLVLVGAAARAGPTERAVLEHGATILALELSRLRGLAETELRLGRELVRELVTGTDQAGALARAQAFGYDVGRPHHVAVVDILRGTGDTGDSALHALRRAARDTGMATLVGEVDGFVVVLADPESPWEALRGTVVRELGGGIPCRIGVGGRCEGPSEIPRSHREALFALAFMGVAGEADRAVLFDDLGVYRLLAQGGDVHRMERFVDSWLGPLIAYDERRGAALLPTLAGFLECGRSHEPTVRLLAIHRNTLKARLRRIEEVSAWDLKDPDIAFTLQLAVRAWRTMQAMRS
jgi:sugar diacid utilization regulator